MQRVPTGVPHDVGKKIGRDEGRRERLPHVIDGGQHRQQRTSTKTSGKEATQAARDAVGFESQRASGFTGVVDLLLHPQDDDHVVVGTGFAQVLVVELPDGRGRNRNHELHVAGHHNSVQGIAMHNKENIFATVGLDCLLILWDATKPIPLQVKTLREGRPPVAIRGPRKHLHHHHHSPCAFGGTCGRRLQRRRGRNLRLPLVGQAVLSEKGTVR